MLGHAGVERGGINTVTLRYIQRWADTLRPLYQRRETKLRRLAGLEALVAEASAVGTLGDDALRAAIMADPAKVARTWPRPWRRSPIAGKFGCVSADCRVHMYRHKHTARRGGNDKPPGGGLVGRRHPCCGGPTANAMGLPNVARLPHKICWSKSAIPTRACRRTSRTLSALSQPSATLARCVDAMPGSWTLTSRSMSVRCWSASIPS